MTVQPYFEDELKQTLAAAASAGAADADLTFALMTDSHLDDNGFHTAENLRAADEVLHFPFLVHMGDLINGVNPRFISGMTMDWTIDLFRSALSSRCVYLTQGNHDGFRDEAYRGQIVHDMALDEFWYEHTGFIDAYPGVCREGSVPYYYVDRPAERLRLIVLCTTGYVIDRENKVFTKTYEIGERQMAWLGDRALSVPDGWSVMLFSHIPPFIRDFEASGPDPVYCRDERRPTYGDALSLLGAFRHGTSVTVGGRVYDFTGRPGIVVCWFFGHDHSDVQTVFEEIPFIGVLSETAYVPQLWQSMGTFHAPRVRESAGEDAWDTVIWHRAERRVDLIRFGRGVDRSFTY